MDISKHLHEKHIVVPLKSTSKFQAIEELVDALQRNHRLNDRDLALKDVLEREGYSSTGLEKGLAIPHAKTDGVSGLEIAFGVSPDGIDFESLDGKPARLIFLVLSPRDTSGPHIQTLATISRNLKGNALREKLERAASAGDVMRIIREDFKA
ncbi:MAG TPA: PTS sugar transporter subunit IIA [Caldithrix abyssi]|uniref:PTS sugar transporter subunit IIA n=1 Tax=Caldithrix abyssi TaxID=187145 RepID=A0A7V4U0B2_CALAY|nr:PTS sugar transporter subunit IIA [Caldithrix abyssi]